MARATRQQSEATAVRILDAARTLFAERGFAAVGLDEVAAHAGVTRGAVYHHYVSKVGLFRAVLDNDLADVDITLEFNEPLYLAEDPAGEIEAHGKTWAFVPFDLWIAEHGEVGSNGH